MKKIYSILALALCLAFTSCYKEDALTPTEGGVELRFNVPQGNHAWDEDIMQIYNDFGVYLVYDELSDADFNRSWTGTGGGAFGATYEGMGSKSDEMTKSYVDFMKTHIFPYLKNKSQVYKKILPMYWYLGYNVNAHSKLDLGFMVLEFHVPQLNLFGGLDYWSLCFFGDNASDDDPYFDPKTQKQYSQARNCILGHIFSEAVQNGNIQIPTDFETGFDHLTSLVKEIGTEEDPNYYLTRGYPGTVNMSKFASVTTPDSGLPPTNENTFIGYILLQMLYSPAELEEHYPSATYPLIAEKFSYVYNYMKTTYGIDLREICAGPDNWETCDISYK